jgi:hypothetical protein
MPDADPAQDALQTYVYGYPLLYNLDEIRKPANGESSLVRGTALNRFAAARDLLGPDAEFVTPNNDTLYLLAAVDLSNGPVLLHVPDTHDRYYVLQLVDAWTNNFAYVGRRATGTKSGDYLLAPTGYDGPVPDGATVIEAPTTVFAIVGRIAVDGEDDVPAVRALQDEFTLTPQGAPVEKIAIDDGDPRVGDDLRWWERLRTALAAFPPPPGDAPFLEVAARLGLTATDSPYVDPDPDPDLRATLVTGQQQGAATVEQLSTSLLQLVDGWSSAAHGFDYNLDHFGIGTIDDPAWKMADRTQAYTLRAVAARAGLWGNHGYEAVYDLLWQDEHGDDLLGDRCYELTLSPPPPVGAFWSLTMYDMPRYYLVANPIDRYAIGDRTPGLQLGTDGSVTVYMQRESPGPGRESNWLPTPAGRFRPVLRAYEPGPSILDGSYRLPKVTRTA